MSSLFDFSNEFDTSETVTSSPTTFLEGLGAAADLALKDTLSFGAIPGLAEKAKASFTSDPEGSEELSVEQLNNEFPGFKWSEPVNRASAKLMTERNQDRQRLEEIISKGPDSNLYKAGVFVTSIATHAIDPLEVASGFLGEGLLATAFSGTKAVEAAALAGKAINTTKFSKVLGAERAFRASVRGKTLIRAAGEGALGNALVEPIIAANMESDLKDYTAYDAFISTAGGALGFSIFRQGLGVLGDEFLSYAMKKNPKLQSRIFVSQLSQMLNGKQSNIDPHELEYVKALNGHPSKGNTPKLPVDVNYEPRVLNATDTPEVDVYVGVSNNKNDFSPEDNVSPGADRGSGVIMSSDNVNFENGVSDGGKIFQGRVKTDSLVDLNVELDDGVKSIIRSVLGDKAPDMDGKTGKQVMDEIAVMKLDGKLPGNAIDDVNAKLKESGKTGYLEHEDTVFGKEVTPHNRVTVFDKKDLNVVNKFSSDQSAVPRFDKEDVRNIFEQINSKENDIDPIDPKDAAEIRQIENTGVDDLEPQKLQKQIDTELEPIRQNPGEGDADDIKKIDDLRSQTEIQERAANGVWGCINRGAG